jgi:hypothetical protein
MKTTAQTVCGQSRESPSQSREFPTKSRESEHDGMPGTPEAVSGGVP